MNVWFFKQKQDLGFTALLTSQVIRVSFYSECEKSDKFCSEVLIAAWGSFTCRKSRQGTHGFTSLPKEVILRIFKLSKNPSTPAGTEPANLGSSGKYDNHQGRHVALRWERGDCIQVTVFLSKSVQLAFMFSPHIATGPQTQGYPNVLINNNNKIIIIILHSLNMIICCILH